jgi:tRNA (mo5U34)-methyltransferase
MDIASANPKEIPLVPAKAPDQILHKRRSEDFSEELRATGWYHSIDLPDGRVIKGFLSIEELRERFAEFPLPSNLSGKRVLDIGTWDGWFAFEAERRGADVVAIDNVEQQNFHYARRELGSEVKYEVAEVYELRGRNFEPFDYVFFLGVLYHLRHPLLALEMVCALTKDVAIVDSFIVDDDYRGEGQSPIPWMEFYETTELSNQIDNWVGPTLECLVAMCRSAGFARVELLNVKHRHARLACYRRWELSTGSTAESPVLRAALNGRWGDNGINFSSKKEEFVTLWFTSSEKDLRREDLRPEIGEFGTRVLTLETDGEDEWHANVFLPPGLRAGWHDVRLRTVRSDFSNACRSALDIAPHADRLEIVAACDARAWVEEVILNGDDPWGYVTLWIAGLATNCDRNNVRVFCGTTRLPVDFVSLPDTAGAGQVNARFRSANCPTEIEILIEHAGVKSNPVRVRIRRDSEA